MKTIESGIYEYKGKEYYAFAQLIFGAGEDKGRLFVHYKALYINPAHGYQLSHVRELTDFIAKFKYLRNM